MIPFLQIMVRCRADEKIRQDSERAVAAWQGTEDMAIVGRGG